MATAITPITWEHSLGVTDRAKVNDVLCRLDLKMAVKLGLAQPTPLGESTQSLLSIEDGWRRYLADTSRPPSQRGASRETLWRYETVEKAFTPYCRAEKIGCSQSVTREVLTPYGTWRHSQGKAGNTVALETNVVKQLVKWLVSQRLLPPTAVISLRVSRSTAVRRYCYSNEEVAAIVDLCWKTKGLEWLAIVVTGLAATGLRVR